MSYFIRSLLLFGGLCLLAGCSDAPTASAPPAKPKMDYAAEDARMIREAMALLPPADRAKAEAQKFCPVAGGALGSMGMPFKVTVKGREVFLCCEGCKDKIESEPDKFLAKLDEEKLESGPPPLK